MTVIREYGDSGLLVEPAADPEEAWGIAQALAASLLDDPPTGLVDVVASFRHAFVAFDPVRTDHATMAAELRARLDRAAPDRPRRTFSVPVVYGGQPGMSVQRSRAPASWSGIRRTFPSRVISQASRGFLTR